MPGVKPKRAARWQNPERAENRTGTVLRSFALEKGEARKHDSSISCCESRIMACHPKGLPKGTALKMYKQFGLRHIKHIHTCFQSLNP